MKVRNLLVSGISLCLFSMLPQEVEAQLFKKIGNVLETVDKVLGSNTTKSEVNTSNDNTTKDTNKAKNVVNGIHQATLYDGKTIMKRPVLTNETKVINVDVDPSIYVNIQPFSDGAAFVKVDKKCFFVDTLGNKLFDYNYGLSPLQEYPRFHQGVCPVRKNMSSTMSLIDKTGKVVIDLPVFNCTNFVDGVALGFISVQKGYSKITRAVYFNTKGMPVYKNLIEDVKMGGQLEPLRPLREGLAAHYSYSSRLYGFRDKDGNLTISPTYSKAQDFSDGLAAVKTTDGKWGFIDKTGKMVIEAKFSSEPSRFSEGYAVVEKKDGTKCYIDKLGNVVFDGLIDANIFYNGRAYVHLNRNSKYTLALIDKSFKVVSEFHTNLNSWDLDEAIFYSNDIWAYNCFVNEDGDMILGADRLDRFFSNGLTYCLDADKGKSTCGCINRKGEFVFIFKESEF